MPRQTINTAVDTSSSAFGKTDAQIGELYAHGRALGIAPSTQKTDVRAVSTSNTARNALPSDIDGVTGWVAGQRILLTGQTNGQHNGIWEVQAGSWSRPTDFDGAGDAVHGDFVKATEGTNWAGTYWILETTGTITIGTTGQTWLYRPGIDAPQIAGGGGGATTLDGLTDVESASPSSGQVLKFNGSAWVPDTDLTGGTATGMTTINDAATMKGATGVSNGEIRLLLGYHTRGDGGGGVMRRNTSLSTYDEGMTFDHNTESGGWERILTSEEYQTRNVRWFGAKGDSAASGGTANQQDIFKKAIDSFGNRMGKLIVPQGIYRFDAKLDLTGSIDYHKLVIEGAGERASNEGYAGVGGSVIQLITSGMTGIEFGSQTPGAMSYGGPEIKNLSIWDATGSSRSEGNTCYGIRTNAMNEWRMERVSFRGCKYGYVNFSYNIGKGRDNSTDFPTDFPRRNFTFWNSTTTYQIGDIVRVTGTTDHYRAIAVNTNQQPPNATYWTPESDQDASWNDVYNCHFYKNTIGYANVHSGGVRIHGCRFEVVANGIGIAHWGGAQLKVEHNKVDGFSTSVFLSFEGENSTFIGNHAEDVGTMIKARDNGGTASGNDLFVIGNFHYQSGSHTFIDAGSGTTGRYGFNYTTGTMITGTGSSSWAKAI